MGMVGGWGRSERSADLAAVFYSIQAGQIGLVGCLSPASKNAAKRLLQPCFQNHSPDLSRTKQRKDLPMNAGCVSEWN